MTVKLNLIDQNFLQQTPKGSEIQKLNGCSVTYKRGTTNCLSSLCDHFLYYTGNRRYEAASLISNLFIKISPFLKDPIYKDLITKEIVVNFGEYDRQEITSSSIKKMYQSCLKARFQKLLISSNQSIIVKTQLMECYFYGYGTDTSLPKAKKLGESVTLLPKECDEKTASAFFNLMEKIYVSQPLLVNICKEYSSKDTLQDFSRGLTCLWDSNTILKNIQIKDFSIDDKTYKTASKEVQNLLIEKVFNRLSSTLETTKAKDALSRFYKEIPKESLYSKFKATLSSTVNLLKAIECNKEENIDAKDYSAAPTSVRQYLFQWLYEKHKNETASYLAEVLFCFQATPPALFGNYQNIKQLLLNGVSKEKLNINTDGLPPFLKTYIRHLHEDDSFLGFDSTLHEAYKKGLALNTTKVPANPFFANFWQPPKEKDLKNLYFLKMSSCKTHMVHFLKLKEALENPNQSDSVDLLKTVYNYISSSKMAKSQTTIFTSLSPIQSLLRYLLKEKPDKYGSWSTEDDFFALSNTLNREEELIKLCQYYINCQLIANRPATMLAACQFYGLGTKQDKQAAITTLVEGSAPNFHDINFYLECNLFEEELGSSFQSNSVKIFKALKSFQGDLEPYILENYANSQDYHERWQFWMVLTKLYESSDQNLLSKLFYEVFTNTISFDLFKIGKEILNETRPTLAHEKAKKLLSSKDCDPAFKSSHIGLLFTLFSGESLCKVGLWRVSCLRLLDPIVKRLSVLEYIAKNINTKLYYDLGVLAWYEKETTESFKTYFDQYLKHHSERRVDILTFTVESWKDCIQLLEEAKELDTIVTDLLWYHLKEFYNNPQLKDDISALCDAMRESENYPTRLNRYGILAAIRLLEGNKDIKTKQDWIAFSTEVNKSFWTYLPEKLKSKISHCVTDEPDLA